MRGVKPPLSALSGLSISALAAIRMPQKISEYVGSKQREEETRTRRSISAHDYANHLNDFVNTLKTTQHRTEVAVKAIKRREYCVIQLFQARFIINRFLYNY